MDKTYSIKGFFKSKQISITDTGVEIQEKSAFNYNEYSFDFTDFTTKKIVKKDANNGLLFFVFMFSISTIVIFISALINPDKEFDSTIIFLLLTIVFMLIAILTKKKVIILPTYYGTKSLEISFSSINEKQARAFADYLLDRVKKYLVDKFTKIDKDLPKDGQLDNLISLRDRDLIGETEFNRLKNILLDKEDDKKIGFS